MSGNNNKESQDCQHQQQQQQQQPGATSTGAEAAVSPVSRLRAQLRDLAASLPEDPELLRWVQATSVRPVTTPPQQYFSPGDRGDLVTPYTSLYQGNLALSEQLYRRSVEWRRTQKIDELLTWRPPPAIRRYM